MFAYKSFNSSIDYLHSLSLHDAMRVADRLRPLWLMWENVPGVLSIDDRRTFGAFLKMLIECGYGIAYRFLNAEYFGVPQRRRRVFVVGYLEDWHAAVAVLLDSTGLSENPSAEPPNAERHCPQLSARIYGGGTDFNIFFQYVGTC